jgi:hypothetical protein
VAANPIDHGELLEPLRQPVDREGVTLHTQVLVHFMMRLDVEGRANIFKLSKGTPEQVDGELRVVEERFIVGLLSRRLLPLLQLCDNPPRKITYYCLKTIHFGH